MRTAKSHGRPMLAVRGNDRESFDLAMRRSPSALRGYRARTASPGTNGSGAIVDRPVKMEPVRRWPRPKTSSRNCCATAMNSCSHFKGLHHVGIELRSLAGHDNVPRLLMIERWLVDTFARHYVVDVGQRDDSTAQRDLVSLSRGGNRLPSPRSWCVMAMCLTMARNWCRGRAGATVCSVCRRASCGAA